jgi:hypothetical protein
VVKAAPAVIVVVKAVRVVATVVVQVKVQAKVAVVLVAKIATKPLFLNTTTKSCTSIVARRSLKVVVALTLLRWSLPVTARVAWA